MSYLVGANLCGRRLGLDFIERILNLHLYQKPTFSVVRSILRVLFALLKSLTLFGRLISEQNKGVGILLMFVQLRVD